MTARKLPEPLLRVPLKVDAIADDGAEPGVDSLQNLVGRIPGLYFESGWGGMFSAPTLRGQQASPTGDLNVGLFVDGVYQANPTAIDSSPIDIERVEIVRGPQSALFGHSTFAGAIHYVSRAPTASFADGFTVESGSTDLAGANGYLSGPVFGKLLGRIAIGTRRYDGTQRNAADGAPLGGMRRDSLALQLATSGSDSFRAHVSARFGEIRYRQPAVASLTYRDYNCGAVEPASGAWSYYCGAIPIATTFAASPGIPDSADQVGQLALTLSWSLGAGSLTSVTTYYRGSANAYRDFDASSTGQIFGVCRQRVTCGGGTAPPSVDRSVYVNAVSRQTEVTREASQEVRFSNDAAERLHWTVGGAAWRTLDHDQALLGAGRGSVAVSERLTLLLPLNPSALGPLALMNAALVTDPALEQMTQSLDREERQTFAAFGALDVALNGSLRARIEARTTHERRELDNRAANFAPGFGTAIPRRSFRDVTPRLSLQYSPTSTWSGHVSAAKGSQSGGINPLPGLLPSEQGYAPEFNWTYEVAARYRPRDRMLEFDATLYSIDWYDTQILGFGQTPGVSNLITLNTAGIRTRGIELSWHMQPWSLLRTEIDLSLTDPQFRRGSDDPGSRRLCGLSSGNTASTLCTIGPSRTGAGGLVPYLDGNVPARVPRHMWHAAIELTPRFGAGRFVARVDANGQDDVFERAIDGARFGARSLLDLRLSYDLGSWSIALWGRNLGDEPYVRALASRGQVFFQTPRPLDAIYGDGRTFGLSATFIGGHLPP